MSLALEIIFQNHRQCGYDSFNESKYLECFQRKVMTLRCIERGRRKSVLVIFFFLRRLRKFSSVTGFCCCCSLFFSSTFSKGFEGHRVHWEDRNKVTCYH